MMGSAAPPGSGSLATVLASLLAAVGVVLWLLLGAVPLGSTGLGYGLDRVSGFFLLWWLVEQAGRAARGAWRGIPGGMMVFAAMDGMGLLAGLALVALWEEGQRRRAGLAVILTLVALALLGGGSFEAMRDVGGDAALAPVAVAVAVLLGGPLGLYVMTRVLLDLAGALPQSAGETALLLGGLAAGFGGWWAWRGQRLAGVADGLRWMLAGFAAMGAGVAIAGQAIDFVGPAALGTGAVWLAAAVAAVCVPVLELVGSGASAGGLRRARIGGLGGLMACAGLALVPPGPGFAVLWQVLRALQSLPVPPLVGAVAASGACAAAGFAAAAMLRLLRVGFGAAEGTEASALVRATMAGLGGLALGVGVVPGAVIALAGGESEIFYAPAALAAGVAGLGVLTHVLARRLGSGGYRVIVLPPPPPPALPGLATGRALRLGVHWRARARRWAAGLDPLAVPAVAGGVLAGLAGMLLLRAFG